MIPVEESIHLLNKNTKNELELRFFRNPNEPIPKRGLLARPAEALFVIVALFVVLGVAVAVEHRAAAAPRGQVRARLLLRATVAKFHRQQVGLRGLDKSLKVCQFFG